MRYVLAGNRNKRLDFFEKACRHQGIDLHVIEMEDILACETKSQIFSFFLPGDIVKIDPVANFGISIEDFHQKIKRYQRALELLSDPCTLHERNEFYSSCISCEELFFLNTPNSILQTLNKRTCKQILQQRNLPVTPMLDWRAHHFEELLFHMKEKRVFQLFIKPLLASGAGGMIALQYHPKSRALLAQSAMLQEGETFVNTKKVRTFRNREQIKKMIDFTLKEDCIFERWMAKDRIGTTVYDLRVLYQFDEICFIQVRGSRESAITNLHLNNMPIDLEQIALPEKTVCEIDSICKQALKEFDGLKVAGFDFLIELHSKKPYIIEINAQGDLIYSDIYKDNTIYEKQVLWMKERIRGLNR